MKKKICFALAVLVMLLTPGSVFALEMSGQAVMQPQYVIISTIDAGLTINSNGKSTSSAVLISESFGSDCYITMELQQKSGSKWTTIKTWTASKLNSSNVSIEKDYYVTKNTYRVKATGVIKNGSVEETAVKYSKEVVY